MFQPLLRRLRLRQDISAWASGYLAGGKNVAACLGGVVRAALAQPVTPHYSLSQVLDRGVQATARGAAEELGLGAQAAAQDELARCVVEKRKYYRLYMFRSKLTFAAMFLRRVRVAGRSFAAALAHLSTVVTPLAPATQNFGVGLKRPCRGQTCGNMLGAMVRIVLTRPTMPLGDSTTTFSEFSADYDET
jgi:hypothetical protein